jgi:hypothetical protein
MQKAVSPGWFFCFLTSIFTSETARREIMSTWGRKRRDEEYLGELGLLQREFPRKLPALMAIQAIYPKFSWEVCDGKTISGTGKRSQYLVFWNYPNPRGGSEPLSIAGIIRQMKQYVVAVKRCQQCGEMTMDIGIRCSVMGCEGNLEMERVELPEGHPLTQRALKRTICC